MIQQIDLTDLSVCLSVCLSQLHKPVLYQNGWTDWGRFLAHATFVPLDTATKPSPANFSRIR